MDREAERTPDNRTVVNTVEASTAPEVLTRGTGLLRLDLAVSLLALAVSVLAFPAPAVAILTLGLHRYTGALVSAVRNRPPKPTDLPA